MTDAVRDVVRHYEQVREEERLAAGVGELERVRTEATLRRFLSRPPARVLDGGGGPGVYAGWLADLGYQVDLIDPVARHVELARARFAAAGHGRGSAHLGDARRLAFEDGSFDAVLLLGPLYHLPEREDRMTALREAYRVLRPGGVLVGAAISRFASLLDGFARDLVRDELFVEILDRDLADGRHFNPTTNPAWFTTAYLQRPDELRAEVLDAGFAVDALVGVEGPFWSMPAFDSLWARPATRALMLGYLDRIESEDSLLGASAHVLALARRSG